MKKVAIIDVTNIGSTGKIGKNLLKGFKERGYEATFFYGRGNKDEDPDVVLFEHKAEVMAHAFLTRLTGRQGFFSKCATKRLVKRIKQDGFDSVVLISPHAYFLNEKIFYEFIAEENLLFINIMPDEYAYLGKCCNEPNCERSKTGKGKCPNVRTYPASWFLDACPAIMKRKRENYQKLKRARFVGPEFVTKNLKRTYLGQFMKAETLDETIDVELYKPRGTKELRREYHIPEEAVVILCVAPPYKGAHYFIDMAQRFHSNKNYFFIYIGKAKCETIGNLLHVNFVEKDIDLAKFYSLADLFIFTSVSDTMPAACLEALACGTPILVFNTSGMPFLLNKEVGTLIEPGNVDAMSEVVEKTRKKDEGTVKKCRYYATTRFDANKYVDKIIKIANSIS